MQKQFRGPSIREYIVGGSVEIVFVPSEKDDMDIFTKNVVKETRKEISMKFMKDNATIY